MSKKNQPPRKFSVTFIIALIISGLIVLAIGGFAVYLKSYSGKNVVKVVSKQYALPEEYTNEDLFKAYARVRKDKEFRTYFRVLTKKQAQEVFVSVTKVLNQNKNSDDLLRVVNDLHAKVVELSEVFYYLNYDDLFFSDLENHSELNRILEEFLISEFKLTVLGVFYKATYDSEFGFKWKDVHVLSARKLLSVISRLNAQQ